MSTLRQDAEALAPKMVEWRRTIHRQPELGYQEVKTAALVAGELRRLGCTVRTGLGGTGVIGDLDGTAGAPAKCIMLRADMDALPIQEPPGKSFTSEVPGLMHACGHDGHVAMLLGAAELLVARKAEFRGRVRFLFQPAEEGGVGAPKVIADGGLSGDPAPSAAFALHAWPFLPAGVFAVRGGPVMAASDRYKISITGRGGHGAYPHLAKDSILAGAQIVTALQSLVAREVDPLDPAVISVTMFHAGTKPNVIPPGAELAGTARSFLPATRDLLEKRVQEIAKGVGSSMGVSVEVVYERENPSVVNDVPFSEFARGVAEGSLGKEGVGEHERTMGAEDFSYYLHKVPGAMARIGVAGPPGSPLRPLHSPDFDLDEKALPAGATVHAAVALAFLARG